MGNIEELIAKLAQDTAAVKPAPHPYMLSLKWVGAAAAYLAVSLAVSGLRPGLMEKFHEPWFAAEIAALLGIFIATSVSAALLAFPDLHQKRGAAFAPALTFALLLLVIFFAWNADSPPAPLPVHSFECTTDITLISLLPAAWTFYAMRQYASTHYHLAGGIALLSAFSVGALWLRLHEINDSIIHLIQWHYLPMLVFGLIGLWLGKAVLKW
ncbi:MAG: hypothetical protein A2V79_11280 [Betaproteobacteria bacterium RBG_16_56_24]|nr:MAG: hypothetical protein A2V79_11280 [Betaproteobacteria bacterium RBG_16_56_24]